MGWASTRLNSVSEAFVAFCGSAVGTPALDIGAAYGTATLAALDTGACVIACDLEQAHLDEIQARAGDRAARLRLKLGSFPRGIHFEEGSLGAVHASGVLHFLTGKQLDEGLRAVARWLRPGGKFFVSAATPYQAPFARFVPEFERRLAAGEPWPGWIDKVSAWCSHRQRSQMPRSIHLLDDRVLIRAVECHSLRVERAWMYRRDDLPANLHFDGRESAGLIAGKP